MTKHWELLVTLFKLSNHELLTYSLVSKVMIIRMGLLFIPPTQLLLHMKLYRMVVNSVPTWNTKQWSPPINGLLICFLVWSCGSNCFSLSAHQHTTEPPILEEVSQSTTREQCCSAIWCEARQLSFFINLLRCNHRHDDFSLLCLFGPARHLYL